MAKTQENINYKEILNPGKYYQVNKHSIGKLDHISNGDWFWSKNWIRYDEFSSDEKRPTWISIDPKYLKELPLNSKEIQLYLPDTHLDRILTLDTLKKDHYYTIVIENRRRIIKSKGGNLFDYMVYNTYFSHSYNSKININRKLVVKLSTDHEIKWLDACIKANKFISENKISNNYVLDKNETDVKEDNKLPDKWCIKITEENYKVVTDYFNKQADTVCYDKNWIGYYLHRYNKANEDIMRKGNLGTSFTESSPRNNYIEISFKQFKYYIRSGKENPFPTLIKGGVYTDNLGNPFRFSHIDHNNQRVYVYCDPNFTDTISPNCFYTSLYTILLNHEYKEPTLEQVSILKDFEKSKGYKWNHDTKQLEKISVPNSINKNEPLNKPIKSNKKTKAILINTSNKFFKL